MDKVFSVLCFFKKRKMFNFNQPDAVSYILTKLSDANYFLDAIDSFIGNRLLAFKYNFTEHLRRGKLWTL